MSVVPDSIEPIIGWKVFALEEGKLTSPLYPADWKPGKPCEAQCRLGYEFYSTDFQNMHEAPEKHCNCGIHIANNLDYALSIFQNRGVIVKMAGWGKVIPGSLASRVQYAYPVEIYVPTKSLRRKLSHYGVPVFLRREIGVPETTLEKVDRLFPLLRNIGFAILVIMNALFLWNHYIDGDITGMIITGLSMVAVIVMGVILSRS